MKRRTEEERTRPPNPCANFPAAKQARKSPSPARRHSPSARRKVLPGSRCPALPARPRCPHRPYCRPGAAPLPARLAAAIGSGEPAPQPPCQQGGQPGPPGRGRGKGQGTRDKGQVLPGMAARWPRWKVSWEGVVPSRRGRSGSGAGAARRCLGPCSRSPRLRRAGGGSGAARLGRWRLWRSAELPRGADPGNPWLRWLYSCCPYRAALSRSRLHCAEDCVRADPKKARVKWALPCCCVAQAEASIPYIAGIRVFPLSP